MRMVQYKNINTFRYKLSFRDYICDYEKYNTNLVLNLTLLKSKRYLGLILVPVVASFSFVTLFTYYSSYLTGVIQFSPSYAGIVMI